MSYSLRSDVRYRRIFGEAVVVRQEEAEVLGLNAVGARVLDCVREGLGVDETVAVLAEEFDVEEPVLAADVASFLAELAEIGVVAEEEDGDGV